MAEGHHGFAYVTYHGPTLASKLGTFDVQPGDVLLAHITDPSAERQYYKVEAPYGTSVQRSFFYTSQEEMLRVWEIVY